MSAAGVVDDAASSISHGRVMFLNEVSEYLSQSCAAAADVVSIRTLGHLVAIDFATQRATIEHNQSQLTLDITTLYEFIAELGSLYEFVGELDTATRVLKCRIWRSMNGCDVALLAKALQLHRESIASLNQANATVNNRTFVP